MDKASKDEIRNRIRALEDGAAIHNYREAEAHIYAILTPLLREAGYEIKPTLRPADSGFDFIAVLANSEAAEDTNIGIEYKHYTRRPVRAETVRSTLGAAFINGLSHAMLIINSGFSRGARTTVSRNLPLEIDLVDLDYLKAWWSRIKIDADIDSQEIEIILKTMSWRFAQLVAEDPENLKKLEWRQIELMLAEVFEGIGFGVELTPSSKDGGKDIILECTLKGHMRYYIVEIKHWRSKTQVGKKAIREFLNVVLKEEREGGLFLSTFGYCNNAFECLTEIERKKLKFGQEEKIISLCQSYLKAESGIWSPMSRLAELLYDGTI